MQLFFYMNHVLQCIFFPWHMRFSRDLCMPRLLFFQLTFGKWARMSRTRAREHESSSERRGTMHVYHGSNSCTHATMHHAGFKIPWVWVAPTSLPNPSRSQWYPKTHPSQQHCQGGPWSKKTKNQRSMSQATQRPWRPWTRSRKGMSSSRHCSWRRKWRPCHTSWDPWRSMARWSACPSCRRMFFLRSKAVQASYR